MAGLSEAGYSSDSRRLTGELAPRAQAASKAVRFELREAYALFVAA